MFGKKLVSQSVIDAVNSVVSADQKDAEGAALSEGNIVRITSGNYQGKVGTILEFPTSGKASVQVRRGPVVTCMTESIVSENEKYDKNYDGKRDKNAKDDGDKSDDKKCKCGDDDCPGGKKCPKYDDKGDK